MPQDLADCIKNNDVARMYLSGVNPYLLRAHCIGVRIPEDESLTPGALPGGTATTCMALMKTRSPVGRHA